MKDSASRRRLGPIDGGWVVNEFEPPVTLDELRALMTSKYGGTPVNTLYWSVGDHEVYFYETKVGEITGEGYEDIEEAARGLNDFPPMEPGEWERLSANVRYLTETFGGPLTVLVKLCREAGIDLFPQVRMNSHYTKDVQSPGYGRFRREHPEYLLGRPGETFPEGSPLAGLRKGLDFTHAEVREHYTDIITELFERFDVDGVDLDFMRHPAYFRPDEAYGARHLITDLIGHVRERMIEVGRARGRALELSVRVPPSLADSARIGLDVAEWMSQGLVDIVVAGGGMVPFDMPFEEFVDAARPQGIQVYGCIEVLRPAKSEDVIRGIASRYWGAGASGIILSNWFTEYLGQSAEWQKRILNEIAGPEELNHLDKRYQLDRIDRFAPVEAGHGAAFRYAISTAQLPATLAPDLSGRTATLVLNVDDDQQSTSADGYLAQATLRFGLERHQMEDELEVRLNGQLLTSRPSRVTHGPWRTLEMPFYADRPTEHVRGTVMELDVSFPPLRRGENVVEVRLISRGPGEMGPIAIRYLELDVRYSQA